MAPYLRTSPSQKSTFELCQRRWGYGSILKLPQTQSAYAAEGEEIHHQREDYQLEGKAPTHPSVALTTSWTPPPKTPGIIIESWTSDPKLYVAGDEKTGGLLVNGRVDYIDERNPKVPEILDWKGKGASFPKTIKTERARNKVRAELEVDDQLNLYGAWVLKKYASAEAVVFGHGYIGRIADPRKPGVVLPAWAELIKTRAIPREHILATVAAMDPTFEEMKKAAHISPDDLPFPPANADGYMNACNAYGEICPYLTRCKKNATASLSDLFPPPESESDTMSIIATLKASPGASSIPNPADFVGVADATPAPETAETDSTEGSLLSRLRAMGASK